MGVIFSLASLLYFTGFCQMDSNWAIAQEFEPCFQGMDEASPRKAALLKATQSIREYLQGGMLPPTTKKPVNTFSRANPARKLKIVTQVKDRSYAFENDRIFCDIGLSQLKKNEYYNYLITADGHISYAILKDDWEFGVKHYHIAFGKPVVAAGALYFNSDDTVTYNLQSGTFSKILLSTYPILESELATAVKEFFKKEPGIKTVQFTASKFLPSNPPTQEEILRLCQSPWFTEKNADICSLELGNTKI